MDGYGPLSVDGGNGRNSGGGGAGGRVAVYHQTLRNFNGTISAGGGKRPVLTCWIFASSLLKPSLYFLLLNTAPIQYNTIQYNTITSCC